MALTMPTHGDSVPQHLLTWTPLARTHSTDDNQEDSRLCKSDLPTLDKDNVSHGCDLLMIDIINKIGWEHDISESARECLSQACAESGHCSSTSFIRVGTGTQLLVFFRYHLSPRYSEIGK